MASVKIEYAASVAATITLASLATSSTLTAGAESDAIDNTTNKYLDYLLAGKITTGSSPSAGTIEVWVVALLDDSTWPDVFDGTGSAETVTSAAIKSACAAPAAAMTTDTTSNQAYPFRPVSVASLFGGVCPKKFVIFCSHNTGVNLNSTGGNHQINLTPVYATVA